MQTLTIAQARRIALAAQGLHRPRLEAPTSLRALRAAALRLQVLQIDSVNVLVRSHYLPLFSRVGSYDRAHLDAMSSAAPRSLVEYWAHEASLVPPELYPYLVAHQRRTWMGASSVPAEQRALLESRILGLLDQGVPLTASAVQRQVGGDPSRPAEGWGWRWTVAKRVLEDLFARGSIGSAGRNAQFERLYAPLTAVLPDPRLAGQEVDATEALAVLADRALGALGVASARSVADYFRTPVRQTRTVLESLVKAGSVRSISVHGEADPWYLHPTAEAIPRKAQGRALLSPFDSLVFERDRLLRLFACHYRIEIYTPEERRVHGYYVLPFLLRDGIAARVDLKADRPDRTLLVRGSYAEKDAPADTAHELAAELHLLAGWLGLDDVVVEDRGDLAPALAGQVGRIP
ncbi:winged helix-turn-helix domain-containing protein [Arthrobacter bussei]|uniref:Winged helix-turn-helix domain-containing protein n=1 Tax=Arthrobacter bussei TaxID=2594179 RepID=A0A7X1NMI5_9MICC|nr:crosslink repair DNA glycosylase YcaQ family protein [Arthrobacter bussei]MPY09540.1 winged helix-turn-helix domain-containing protein [Arthrobacter bussei]